MPLARPAAASSVLPSLPTTAGDEDCVIECPDPVGQGLFVQEFLHVEISLLLPDAQVASPFLWYAGPEEGAWLNLVLSAAPSPG